MTFGRRLKYLREMKGWTLEEVASLYNRKYDANISKGAISRYENDLHEPMLNVVIKFAKLYNVSPTYLLNVEDDEETQSIVDFVNTNPAAKIFFDTAKNCSAADILLAIKILDVIKDNRNIPKK